MDEVVEASEGQLRLITRLLGGFAGAAMLVAMIGLYAVISYLVALRTREFGIRQALGAERRNIFWLVMGRSLRVSCGGAVLGLGAGLVLSRFLKDLLFQVSPTDPMTFAAISTLVLPVAVLASYIPARRAGNVDPMAALRYE